MITSSRSGPQSVPEGSQDNFWLRNLTKAKAVAASIGDLDEVRRIEDMQRQAHAKRAS